MSENSKNETLQIIGFKLNDEEYALEIENVQEIIKKTKMTRVARSKDYIKGVINLRGIVFPIIDLKYRFNMSSQTYDDNMRIIILEVNGVSAGIMVDSVSEVIEVDKSKILANPQQSNSEINTDYLKGVCKVNEDRLMTLLNIEKVLEIKNN
ncbi:purine-binding chemotaxis protein CheW [Hypnocyclicus thermotrophus]|uniref:Purine-binding chemotaxis protein CheW n=1 Tax=Hypnocyclicus thermotrophus TaxID=1627895 RepID=A0AA46DXN0_9FUSO|nr:chemotaxis protein CheW [Hypnocyclicus thermotrophus]TDT68568.1 purine-binding chemotaxis protein CheW [Hypnocyclicus thermotrophus]